ncbi:MAG: metallophosphoesterase, partial [Gemmatimonadetes bacterium]|nr:metallophosphoesterase [Gemmatimonadota bacterium]
HLGFRQFQRLDAEGVNQRETDVAAAFRRAIDAAIARAPDVVLIAGDLFHAVRPTNRSIIEAFTQLARLRAALPEAPVVLIAGNHDTPRSVEAGSILKLMSSLGVEVVDDQARRIEVPRLGLSVLAVPHAALLGGARDWHPDPHARHNLLVLHPEIAGLFPENGASDYGGIRIRAEELRADEWDYVALGHYHVVHEVAPRAWYSGSLEYTSPNIWGEVREEEQRKVSKGILIADLESGAVERVALPPARAIHDLPRLDAAGMTAVELDAAIQGRLAELGGGVAGAVVRLVVENVPRALAHALDHASLRAVRAEALHFHLDLRRPEPVRRTAGNAGPGTRRTLPEVVADYLGRRPLDAELDRGRLVALGRAYMDAVERALAEGEA